MSLLNDMLRDLSHQQKVADPLVAPQPELDLHAQEQRELFYNSSAVKALPRTWVPSAVVFVLVLTLLALWKSGIFVQQDVSKPALVPVTDLASAENTALDQTIDEGLAGQKAEQGIEQKNIPQEVLATQKQSVVEQSGEEHPIVEPELGARIAALESAITNLSTVIANTNIPSTNETVVAMSTTENISQDVEFEVRDAEQLIQPEQTSALADAELPSFEESASVSIQEPFPHVGQVPDNEPLKTVDAAQGEPKLSIAPNAKWQDQQQAQQAQLLIAQGQTDVAIVKLQDFIAATEEPRESVKALLDIFASQESADAMQALIAQASYLSDIERSFYAAKITIIQQQDAQAIEILEAHLDKAEQHENYRALLASLYQRTGMHVEAATHYRRLLGSFGDKPAYWLGFALAQDALDQAQVATQAYMRVNQYADLQPQVRTYVQQRIAALQQ